MPPSGIAMKAQTCLHDDPREDGGGAHDEDQVDLVGPSPLDSVAILVPFVRVRTFFDQSLPDQGVHGR